MSDVDISFNSCRDENGNLIYLEVPESYSSWWHNNAFWINAKTASQVQLPTREQDNSEEAELLRCFQDSLKEHFKREEKEREKEELEERQRKNRLEREKRWAERDANPKPSNQKSKKKKNKEK
jgi:hypothetical protein